MIVLGVVLAVIGWIVGIPVLWTIGLVLVVLGLILLAIGSAGRTIAGRRYWY